MMTEEMKQSIYQRFEREAHRRMLSMLERDVQRRCLREGRIAALWLVLEARGLIPTASQKARVEACDDESTMDEWIRRAAHASDVEELFGR